jgi:hypothetical protein
MGKKSVSGMKNPDHISERLETIFWDKKIWIRDGKKKILIPDPQHCLSPKPKSVNSDTIMSKQNKKRPFLLLPVSLTPVAHIFF